MGVWATCGLQTTILKLFETVLQPFTEERSREGRNKKRLKGRPNVTPNALHGGGEHLIPGIGLTYSARG